MRYTEVKQLLQEHALRSPTTGTHDLRGKYEVIHTLRVDGEVSLRLLLAAEHDPKRGRVWLKWDSFLYSPRLVTHPNDKAFSASVASMPNHVQVEVLALRDRLDGNISISDLTPWIGLSDRYPPVVSVEDWGDAEFFDWLVAVLSFAQGVASSRLPVRTAERLLVWAKSPRPSELPFEREFRLGLCSAWRVRRTKVVSRP
ncbi:hypothetical protein [Ideonella sp.]|jgi:hypothetical protein|uniref:hypothetical protein n=1 Tax=Ideonella sp. TaxID=1929293 RepID=UPI0037C18621